MLSMEGSNCLAMAKEEDPSWPNLGFPSKLAPLDYLSGSAANYGWEWQFSFPMQEEGILDATVPFEEESFTSYSVHPSLDIVEYNPTVPLGDIYLDHKGGGVGLWSEPRPLMDSTISPLLLCNNVQDNGEEIPTKNKGSKRLRDEEKETNNNMNSASKMLTREAIAKHFYMSITEAAKQLNVGLTLLKKRCRELGIHRWPHRKLMSLQTLIRNVQELAKEGGGGSEEKLREALEVLESERKQLEESPDTQLGTKTKRLRQACFKANYKKRKLISTATATTTTTTTTLCPNSSITHAAAATVTTSSETTSLVIREEEEDDDDDDDEIRSILSSF